MRNEQTLIPFEEERADRLCLLNLAIWMRHDQFTNAMPWVGLTEGRRNSLAHLRVLVQSATAKRYPESLGR